MTEDTLTIGFEMKARVEAYRPTVMIESRKRSAIDTVKAVREREYEIGIAILRGGNGR